MTQEPKGNWHANINTILMTISIIRRLVQLNRLPDMTVFNFIKEYHYTQKCLWEMSLLDQ